LNLSDASGISILFNPKYGDGYILLATKPVSTVDGTLTGNQ